MALTLTLAPTDAAAWCRLPGDYVGYWAERFPDLRIPVYLAVGKRSNVLYTQLTRVQMAAIVQRVIAVHNETVATPTLYYAGETEAELDAEGESGARPAGIVVESYACTEIGGPASCAEGQLACTTPGGNTPDTVGKTRLTFQPALCEANGVTWGIEYGMGKDVTRVLLHEFGHALGLGHTGDPACPGASDGGTAGVMKQVVGAADAYERSWRSDDIAGLREIYGGALRHGVVSWADEAFPAAPDEAARTAICAEIRTPPSLTAAVGAGATLLLGATDAEDRVVVLAWDGASFVAPVGGAVVDPSPQGTSLAPVGLAHSEGAPAPVVMAVWSSEDSPTQRSNRLRWAIRGLDGGSWKYGYFATPSGPTQVGNRVAVGYDPGRRRFLVVSIEDHGEPYVLLVDAEGEVRATASLGREAFPMVYAFDVGRPVCRAEGEDSRCVVPYTSGNHFLLSSDTVLQPGWLEVELGVNEGVVLVDQWGPATLEGHGLMDLAPGSGELRGVAGEQRFGLADGEVVPVLENERLAGGDWPLRIGSHAGGGQVSYRIVGRRIAACGDGVVDCAEECDDGNTVGEDGCSAQCEVEVVDGTTGAQPTGGGATSGMSGVTEMPGSSSGGAGAVPGDDGCGCATGGGLPGVVLLGLLRRRRR